MEKFRGDFVEVRILPLPYLISVMSLCDRKKCLSIVVSILEHDNYTISSPPFLIWVVVEIEVEYLQQLTHTSTTITSRFPPAFNDFQLNPQNTSFLQTIFHILLQEQPA